MADLRTMRDLALLLVMCLLFSTAGAEGFSFGSPAVNGPALPAQIFELDAARRLRELAVPDCAATDGLYRLHITLPQDCSVTASTTEGTDLAVGTAGADTITLACDQMSCWLNLSWTDGDTAYTARYLFEAGGACELWEAFAEDVGRKITRKNSRYTLEPDWPDVSAASLYYREDGQLQSALLMGDRRETGSLPLTVQYDCFGRATSVTAADLRHSYRYSRPLASWLDENGETVVSPELPPFELSRHPAPAALPLSMPRVCRTEAAAGIDRAALLAAAPALSDLEITTDSVLFVSDADEALLTADGSVVFSSRQGSIAHSGTAFTADATAFEPGATLELALTKDGVTAVYRKNALVSVSDGAGVTLYADGTLTLETAAAAIRYSASGRLKQAEVEQADGARVTYGPTGQLIGWSMDGYLWSRDDGWRTTAVNENGSVIHPGARAPTAVRLSDYPPLTIYE